MAFQGDMFGLGKLIMDQMGLIFFWITFVKLLLVYYVNNGMYQLYTLENLSSPFELKGGLSLFIYIHLFIYLLFKFFGLLTWYFNICDVKIIVRHKRQPSTNEDLSLKQAEDVKEVLKILQVFDSNIWDLYDEEKVCKCGLRPYACKHKMKPTCACSFVATCWLLTL